MVAMHQHDLFVRTTHTRQVHFKPISKPYAIFSTQTRTHWLYPDNRERLDNQLTAYLHSNGGRNVGISGDVWYCLVLSRGIGGAQAIYPGTAYITNTECATIIECAVMMIVMSSSVRGTLGHC